MKKALIFVTLLFLIIANLSCTQKDSIDTSSPIISKSNPSDSSSDNEKNSVSNVNKTSSALNNEENLSDLQEKGLKVIENQSFWVELENWGKVRFVSRQFTDEGTFKLQFYLVDDKGNILYNFPDFYNSKFWFFYELRAIAFKDVNKDGLKDIVVIADYVSGVGEQGAIPFPVGSVYFQKENEFVNIPELDEQINDANKNETIDMIQKFVEEKSIKLNE